MFAESFPSPSEYLAQTRRIGAPAHEYNKLSIFNPDAIRETGYAVGRHRATPEGLVRYPEHDQLLLFHYKFLGVDYLIRRYALLKGGLGPVDRANAWGAHYLWKRSKLKAEFAQLRLAAMDVTGAAAGKLARQKWWRPDASG
jgi:hypothetical protein